MEKLICRIVYTAFVVCWSVNGAFVTSPSNVAVLTNNVVVFTCITDSTSSNPVLIDWYYTAVGAGRTLIAANCDVLQQHQSGYRIEGAAPGVCNLTVNSVKLTNAGTFWCQDRESGDFSSAELVVLESLTSSTSATENTAESDVMQYNCSVAFSGSGKISPSIRWTSEGTDVTGGVASTSSSNRADSVYTVTAGTSNIPPCQCDVYFPQTSVSGNDAAQNRPTYADRQDFEEIIVTYCPRNVKIHDVVNDSKIDGGTELSCSAKANPSATFHWTNLTGDVDVTGSSFTVEANTFYVLTCTATNNITYSDGRQQTCSDSYTVTFNTTDVPPTTTPQLTSAAGSPTITTIATGTGTSTTSISTPTSGRRHEGDKDDLTLILALALGIGIPVLIVIFILLFCCCCPCCPLYDKCCRRGKQNRYDASEHDVGSTDGRSGQVMMDNMGYDDKPPDPYRRPDVVTDNKPPAAYNPPYPQATNPEPVVYAQLQVPDQPRSRTPVVEPSNTVYGNILSA